MILCPTLTAVSIAASARYLCARAIPAASLPAAINLICHTGSMYVAALSISDSAIDPASAHVSRHWLISRATERLGSKSVRLYAHARSQILWTSSTPSSSSRGRDSTAPPCAPMCISFHQATISLPLPPEVSSTPPIVSEDPDDASQRGARARVAIAQGEPERAERDAHDALTCSAEFEAHLSVPDILECLASLAKDAGSHRESARLFGAAHGIRQRMGAVRFKIYDADYHASVTALRDAMGDSDFDSAWAEGTALSTEEAIAYAQRGRSQRKRPTSGWGALTPTERDVVRLVSEGLGNNDIATRLFVSPRTVQTHLTHVYTKLGLSSRVQLVQEAARHG
jgi:DNA-binding CsgD family transcriptional regulator